MSADVNFICKIDRELYRVVEQELLTEEVIITEEQILHIEEGHPGDYGRLSAYISQVLQEPDYILRGNRPHTALVLNIDKNSRKSLQVFATVPTQLFFMPIRPIPYENLHNLPSSWCKTGVV